MARDLRGPQAGNIMKAGRDQPLSGCINAALITVAPAMKNSLNDLWLDSPRGGSMHFSTLQAEAITYEAVFSLACEEPLYGAQAYRALKLPMKSWRRGRLKMAAISSKQ